MTRILFLLFLLVVLSDVKLFEVSGAVLTVSPPQLVTVSPFGIATLKYEGAGNQLNLLVQNAPLTPAIQQQRSISVTNLSSSGNLSSILTIVGLPVNDGVGIGCQVLSYQPFEQVLSGTTLKIKGVSPVEDLMHNFPTNNSLLISWLAPVYYSNDVPFGSLFHYQVLVTDEEDGDIILDTNTTDTNIEVANITECDTFDISVTVVIYEYTSINTVSNNGSYSITEYNTQPLIPSISFKLGCPPSRCLVSLMDGNTEVTDITTETENIIEFKLSPFRHYELTAVVKNLRGKTRATYSTLLSTFHTQDIIISSPHTNGSVSVQCVFVSGSTADGCHVIFNDTSNRMVLNMSLQLVQEPTLVTLPAGNYTVTAYDIDNNGSLHGPAVYYPTLIEIIKMHFTSSSTHESISSTASIEVILTPTSSTTIPTLGTETTSSTSETFNDTNDVVPIVAGTVSGSVLLILIILAVCVSITVYKRKKMNGQELIRSEFATIHQSQAETNHYQYVHELRIEVPIDTGSPVMVTSGRLINEEDPYHVNRSEFLSDNSSPIVEGQLRSQWQQRPSLISTTTQETTLEDSISSTTSNNIHDNAYTTDPTVTVNVSNDTNTNIVAAPTYASIAKRTNTTVIPVVDQHVVYSNVTGDVNKRGDVKFYCHDDANNIVTGDLNLTTSKDEVANLSDSPSSYDDLDTITDLVIEHSGNSAIAVSPQAVPNECFYSEPEEISQMDGASTFCVMSPVEQPKNETDDSDRQIKHPNDANPESTPLLPLFSHQLQEDNNNHNGCITAQEDDDVILDSQYELSTENINNDMMIVSRATSQQLSGKEEEKNIEIFEAENTCKRKLISLSFLLCLLIVTVTAALLSSQYSDVCMCKIIDGDNHTEMVSLAHHYNYNWKQSCSQVRPSCIMEEKEDQGQGFIPNVYRADFLSIYGDHCLNCTGGDSVDGLSAISCANMNDEIKVNICPYCEDELKSCLESCPSGFLRGQKDDDTGIMATVKDSLNHTVHHCNISSLPYLVNYTVPSPDICDVNPAEVGEPSELADLFEKLIDIQLELSRLLSEFNDSAHALLVDSTSKSKESEFGLRCAFTVITVNFNILNENLYFQVPVNKIRRNEIFYKLLVSIGDHRVVRNHFKFLKFDTTAKLLKMNMHWFYNIYGKDNHYSNSNEAVNGPRKRLEWWILVIIEIFFMPGTSHCASFLMIVNTVTVWINKKLKKLFKNRVHLAEVMEGLVRFLCYSTHCSTIITKQITFQEENWKLLEGSCPTTPAVTPTDQFGTDARFYWKEVIKIEHLPSLPCCH